MPPQSATPQSAIPQSNSSSSAIKRPLIIALIISVVIILVESIALVTMAMNLQADSEDVPLEEELDEYSVDYLTPYEIDAEDNIVALELTCENENGDKYIFTKAKQYTKTSGSNTGDSGTYSIINSSAIVLNDPTDTTKAQTVYYDGIYIIEGTTFYDCEEKTEG